MEFVYDESKHADQEVIDPGQQQIFAVLDTLLAGLLQGARETFVTDGFTVHDIADDDEVFNEVRLHLSIALGHAHSAYWERLIEDPANVAHADSRKEIDQARIEAAQDRLFGKDLAELLRDLDS